VSGEGAQQALPKIIEAMAAFAQGGRKRRSVNTNNLLAAPSTAQ
jgi:ATP-dependent protease Clp ATPase subunit